MKLQIVSDLHLEFGTDITIPNMSADVLILGGDIIAASSGTYESFFERCSKTFEHVVYIMGNHEHYHGNIDTDEEVWIRPMLDLFSNVHFLEKTAVEIEGIPFFGATLWTDCNGENPDTMWKVQRGLNDYRLIETGDGHRMSVTKTIALFKETIEGLKAFLADNADRPVVVCTHHSPLLKSIRRPYDNDYHINGGYHSDLLPLIEANPNIKLWTHGHCHISRDDFETPTTRIVCNAAGYPIGGGKYERENPDFDPEKIVEI